MKSWVLKGYQGKFGIVYLPKSQSLVLSSIKGFIGDGTQAN